jgi:hypothetical protein
VGDALERPERVVDVQVLAGVRAAYLKLLSAHGSEEGREVGPWGNEASRARVDRAGVRGERRDSKVRRRRGRSVA